MSADDLLKDAMRRVAYDPITGLFTRCVGCTRWPAGVEIGYQMANGYIGISLSGRECYAHRLAWAMQTGEWPELKIDHINGARTDNRWANLRLASDLENGQNLRRAHSDSATGVLGVSIEKASGLFVAQISHRGKKRSKRFERLEDARAMYLTWKRELHAGCTL